MNEIDPNISGTVVVDSPNVVCECGCKTFLEAVVLKKISPVISRTGREEMFPIPVFICSSCGKIPAEYLEKGNAKRILGEETKKEETKIIM